MGFDLVEISKDIKEELKAGGFEISKEKCDELAYEFVEECKEQNKYEKDDVAQQFQYFTISVMEELEEEN